MPESLGLSALGFRISSLASSSQNRSQERKRK